MGCLEGEDRRFLRILAHHITLFQSYISAAHAEVLAAEVRYFNYRCGSKYVHYTGFQVRINKNTLCLCTSQNVCHTILTTTDFS